MQIRPEYTSYKRFLPVIVKNLFNGKIEKPFKYALDRGLYKAIKSTKRLFLSRMVKFNGKYFSSISIPGFPSKAYNNMYKNGGLYFSENGTPRKRHFETALLGISDDCPLNCAHCYEKENLKTKSPVTVEKWKSTISELQKRGVSIIVLTGGEPLINFEHTIEILKSGDKDLSDFHIHTSGFSLTMEKALALKNAGLISAAVGLDDYDLVRHEKIRGKGSFKYAVDALKVFNKAGIMTYVNLCATKDLVNNGSLFEYYEFVNSLNVSFIQLLEPRRCGGYLNSDDILLGPEEKNKLREFASKAAFDKKYKDYPVVYYIAHLESKEQNGCGMGGLSILYIDTRGNVNPCVFMPVAFGSILENDMDTIFRKLRTAIPMPVFKDCPSNLFSKDIYECFKKDGIMPVPYETLKHKWSQTLYNN